MKIYTNEIDLARPILKKFYTAPCSDYKFGVKIVQGKNYVIELNGVELESDGETGGYKTYKMTSPKEQGVELFKIICENGQIVYIKHVTTDSTVFDVDEGGGSAPSGDVVTKVNGKSPVNGNVDVDKLKITDGFITGDVLMQNISNIENELNGKANAVDVPTKTSQLNNDSDFATNASVDEKIGGVTSSITTKTSELDNDSGFLTNSDTIDTANRANAVDWTGVENTPTTLEGYGITDAATTEYVDNTIGNVLTQEEF